jgi:hypothetical protein
MSQAAPANNTPSNAASTYKLVDKMAQYSTDSLSAAAKQSLSIRA